MSGLGFMSGAELELTWPPNKVPTTRGSSVVGRSASPVIFCHCICFPSIWTCHRHFIWSMISQGLLEGEHSSILCLGLKAVWLHENPDRFDFPAKLFIPCNDMDYIRQKYCQVKPIMRCHKITINQNFVNEVEALQQLSKTLKWKNDQELIFSTLLFRG